MVGFAVRGLDPAARVRRESVVERSPRGQQFDGECGSHAHAARFDRDAFGAVRQVAAQRRTVMRGR
ncbi:MAG: hypothetical protein ACKODX_18680 [Gemmata sp.]